MKRPKWEVPAAPGTSPIPDDHVRLYHQTHEKNFSKIKREGIKLQHAKGIEGPRAIYADEKGFYGKPEDGRTVEFHVHKSRWNAPYVTGDVEPHSIIAVHKKWHQSSRYIEDSPESKDQTVSGHNDSLLKDKGSDEAKAVRFIKKKYKK